MQNEELIKALKEDAEWAHANEWETPITLGDHLDAAAAALEAADKAQRWIPVNERLPEHEREAVLAYQRDFNEAHIAWISGGYWEDTSGTFAPGKITHWMPLPEPPRKDDEA